MFRVIIVDDEPLVLRGLQKGLVWEELGCEVVGTAGDGREGLRLVEQLQPDILLTDIHMPELDGLSMIAGLRSSYPDMQIIILTGYRDFEYAQKALHLGVRRFLIKPSRMDELLEAIECATQTLETLSGAPEAPDEQVQSYIVGNALRYMHEHFAEKITLQEVAEQTFVSQWHLSKLFKKHTEQNFSDTLNKIRIEHAQKLLTVSAMKIYLVAERCGFTDMTHFSRVFKRYAGMTAQEYRNTNGQGHEASPEG